MSSLSTLIERLAGANVSDETTSAAPQESAGEHTDPVYVEKLASAVDFIIDNFMPDEEIPTEVQEEDEEKIASVAALSERLKDSLQTKLAAKKQEGPKDNEIAEAVLGKLLQLRSASADASGSDDTADEDGDDEVEALLKANEDTDETSVSDEADGVAAEKAASVEDYSLADVLHAALENTDEQNESADESVKTAGVRGSEGPIARKEATQRLKDKLLAKVGKEV